MNRPDNIADLGDEAPDQIEEILGQNLPNDPPRQMQRQKPVKSLSELKGRTLTKQLELPEPEYDTDGKKAYQKRSMHIYNGRGDPDDATPNLDYLGGRVAKTDLDEFEPHTEDTIKLNLQINANRIIPQQKAIISNKIKSPELKKAAIRLFTMPIAAFDNMNATELLEAAYIAGSISSGSEKQIKIYRQLIANKANHFIGHIMDIAKAHDVLAKFTRVQKLTTDILRVISRKLHAGAKYKRGQAAKIADAVLARVMRNTIRLTITFIFHLYNESMQTVEAHDFSIDYASSAENADYIVDERVKELWDMIKLKGSEYYIFEDIPKSKRYIVAAFNGRISGMKPLKPSDPLGRRIITYFPLPRTQEEAFEYNVQANPLTALKYEMSTVDSESAPNIYGRKSFTGPYGCAAAAAASIVDMTEEDILNIMLNPINEIIDELDALINVPIAAVKVDEEQPIIDGVGREGIAIDQLVDFLNTYANRQVDIVIEGGKNGKRETIRCGKLSNKKIEEWLITNAHIYGEFNPITPPTTVELLSCTGSQDKLWTDITKNIGAKCNVRIPMPINEIISLIESTGYRPSVKVGHYDIKSASVGQTMFTQDDPLIHVRYDIFKKAQAKFPLHSAFKEWKDQGFAAIAQSLFTIVNDYREIPKSFDNVLRIKKLEAYNTSAIMWGNFDNTLELNVNAIKNGFIRGFDMVKLYFNCMLNLVGLTPVFDAIDESMKMDFMPDDAFGEVLIKPFTYLGIYVESRHITCSVWKKMIDAGMTDGAIFEYTRASGSMLNDDIIRFAKFIKDEFPEEFKHLYVHFVGLQAARSHRTYNGLLTTDPHERDRMLQNPATYSTLVDPTIDLYCIHTPVREIPFMENTAHVYRRIVSEGIFQDLNLATLCKDFGPCVTNRCDSILYDIRYGKFATNVNGQLTIDYELLNTAESQIDITFAKRCEVKESSMINQKLSDQQLLEKEYYELTNYQNYLQEPRAISDNVITQAAAGYGKTVKLGNDTDNFLNHYSENHKVTKNTGLNLTQSHLAKNGMALRTENMPSYVFDEFYSRYIKPGRECAHKFPFNKLQLVNIDEFGWYGKIGARTLNYIYMMRNWTQKSKQPLTIRAYGDDNQMSQPGWDGIKFTDRPSIRYMFDHCPGYNNGQITPNIQTIAYHDKVRYTPPTNEALDKFLLISQLPQAFLNRVISVATAQKLGIVRHIAYTNECVNNLNNYNKDATLMKIVIKTDKKAGYFKGEMLTNEEVAIRKIPADALVTTYAITCHKSQGQTFDIIYAIRECHKFSKELMYTALSRCTDLNKLYIIHEDKSVLAQKVFLPEKSQFERELLQPTVDMIVIDLITADNSRKLVKSKVIKDKITGAIIKLPMVTENTVGICKRADLNAFTCKLWTELKGESTLACDWLTATTIKKLQAAEIKKPAEQVNENPIINKLGQFNLRLAAIKYPKIQDYTKERKLGFKCAAKKHPCSQFFSYGDVRTYDEAFEAITDFIVKYVKSRDPILNFTKNN